MAVLTKNLKGLKTSYSQLIQQRRKEEKLMKGMLEKLPDLSTYTNIQPCQEGGVYEADIQLCIKNFHHLNLAFTQLTPAPIILHQDSSYTTRLIPLTRKGELKESAWDTETEISPLILEVNALSGEKVFMWYSLLFPGAIVKVNAKFRGSGSNLISLPGVKKVDVIDEYGRKTGVGWRVCLVDNHRMNRGMNFLRFGTQDGPDTKYWFYWEPGRIKESNGLKDLLRIPRGSNQFIKSYLDQE